MNAVLALLFLLIAAPLSASAFEGRVVRVKDGDSLLVARADVKRTSEVRLAGIDAPELGQPWGIQSRTALRRLVGDRTVRVTIVDRDRYGRLVGKVEQGRVYVNAALVEGGHAWAFSRYMPDARIRAAQQAARAAGRGLWGLPPEERLPPATWRARYPRRD
jgi:endonuclease YncB( thermonuclease family)